MAIYPWYYSDAPPEFKHDGMIEMVMDQYFSTTSDEKLLSLARENAAT